MPRHVVEGARLMCSFGTTPSVLGVPPKNREWCTTAAANIMDHVPQVNIRPFGMCMSPANPQVAAATAAALGVLTPQPCLPCTATPWTPGVPNVSLVGPPILNDTSMLMCNWGGQITVVDPGQQTKFVP
jgi:hypothetical protein